MAASTTPQHNDTPRQQDPDRVAQTVRANWAAHESLAEWRQSVAETPERALDRRLERIEAALCSLWLDIEAER